jgi:hypothetical protein
MVVGTNSRFQKKKSESDSGGCKQCGIIIIQGSFVGV